MHVIDLIGPKGEEHHFSFAEGWHDLTEVQLGQVSIELLSGINETALRFRMLRLLAGIPKRLFIRIYPDDLIEPLPDRGEVLPQLDWLFGKPVFDVSILPVLTIRKHRYQGPTTALGNFSVLQLSFADICFSAVQEKGTGEALNDLLGALYYPEGGEWNHADIELRGKTLSELPMHTKLAALLNYKGLRNTLPLRYPRTFTGAEAKDDFGIDGLLEGLAGPKFGRVDQVGAQALHPALVNCERMLVREAEIKAENAKRA